MALGKLVRAYRYSWRPLGGLCALFGGITLLACWSAQPDERLWIVLAITALLVALVVYLWRGPAQISVFEYQHGLVVRRGEREVEVPWDALEGVAADAASLRTAARGLPP
jgi:hypothetical protein